MMTSEDEGGGQEGALPPLFRDRGFWGMTATQFLGAFNDNVFKQLVLLLCLDFAHWEGLQGDPYQPWAQALFSLPFVLFSGFAGWLSDRNSKRTIVVLCKGAEIGVMLAGLAAFWLYPGRDPRLLYALLAVLFLMGTHSAFFGPAKYGILPELLRERDLPTANGLVQMTTFLAIIGGTAVCGLMKQRLEGTPEQPGPGLWVVSATCVAIAVVGTLTSLFIRRTRIAAAGEPFRIEALLIDSSTIAMLRHDRVLRGALLATVLFWFLGGVTLPAVNSLGKDQLDLPAEREDAITSALAACMGLGIAVGCGLAAALSKHRVSYRLVRGGSWGMFGTFLGLVVVPRLALSYGTVSILCGILLVGLGISAGIYAIPLQVVLQSRPSPNQKGRMIGAMNLCTWTGILASAGFYFVCSTVFSRERIANTFGVLALMALAMALFYRPTEEAAAGS